MTLFLICAALMLAAALGFVLPPLLRVAQPNAFTRKQLKALDDARTAGVLNDDEYEAKREALSATLAGVTTQFAPRPRSTRFATIAIALLLPAAAILLYRYVGNPNALDPAALVAPADHGADMEQAIAGLASKLQQDPNDAQGWTLLGRAYEATQRFAQARDALAHAHTLAADNADITVAYAEALALSTPSRRIEGEPRTLLEGVLKSNPDNERGLWLFGISDYQRGHYDEAIATWQHLLAVLPKDSDIVATVQHEIAQAEAERDGRTSSPAGDSASPSAADVAAAEAPASTPRLQVEVALDAKLRDRLAPDDVLFVYAKAAHGPPMPLAIQRLPANKLPASVTLTEAMGMLPNMKLSQFPQVIVGARISRSGNATPQSGDLQTVSAPLPVSTSAPIKLTIDQVVP